MTINLTALERYRPLVEDWNQFAEALTCPLPSCIWTNRLRATPKQLSALMAAEGAELTPLSWNPAAFKVNSSQKLGHLWPYWAGLYQIQEEVSMIPIRFLDPQPEDRVLDLCAAPGNKTAQIAVAMENRGTVIANDYNIGRMRATRQVLERLGLINVTTTSYDGANYQREAGTFDKVLVDVPCSCEGTTRKNPHLLELLSQDGYQRRTGLQQALLRKAVQLCRPGGRIVYATCTYAPEENEMIVDAILQAYGDALRMLPAQLPNFTASAGITHWAGQSLHPSLTRAMRVWPHQNDSGGFFVAVIEKLAPTTPAAQEDVPPLHDHPLIMKKKIASEFWLNILSQRFGFNPSLFADYLIFQPNRDTLYLINKDHRPPVHPEPDSMGLALMKASPTYPKLSTPAAMVFGTEASRNYLTLTRNQAEGYLTRQVLHLADKQFQTVTGKGFLLPQYQRMTLGVAYYPADKDGPSQVASLFPKSWANQIDSNSRRKNSLEGTSRSINKP